MTPKSLPRCPALSTVSSRLPEIFPEGVDHRNYLTRDIAAKTVFVMFYAGAVDGYDRWIRPNQVTRMTDRQANDRMASSRGRWAERSRQPSRKTIPGRWYADNTREPIRDETIRLGLIPVGAVVEREGLSTTSSLPRYALRKEFAALLTCSKAAFRQEAARWRAENLTAGALARLQLLHRGVGRRSTGERVEVTLPNGSVRRMSPGPSSEISKAVIEDFTNRFLEEPGVVFLSESSEKVVSRDDELARSIGLDIDAGKVLPDIILVDLGPRTPLLVFVEVVATDGPVSESRKHALLKVAQAAGYEEEGIAFVTALRDRGAMGVFRKVSSVIAWNSFVWFASEPDRIIHYNSPAESHRYLHQMHGGTK